MDGGLLGQIDLLGASLAPLAWAVVVRSSRLVTTIAVLSTTALAVSACGDDASVPDGSIARVGDEAISRTDFDHWMKIAYVSTQQQAARGGDADVQVPAPPSFTTCVADKRKKAATPTRDEAATTTEFTKQCEQEYDKLRNQVVQFLINYEWVAGEAEDRGLKVTDQTVEAEVVKTRKQFSNEADFKRFLASQGLTLQDVRFQVRLQQLQVKIRDTTGEEVSEVTPAAVAAYYKKNRSDFVSGETRDVRAIVVKTKALAKKARNALASGRSWRSVAAQYSTDPKTRTTGGLIRGLKKSAPGRAQTSALDALNGTIFASKKGALIGPKKAQLGFSVLQVQTIAPPRQQTETQSTRKIRQLLTAQSTLQAQDRFGKDFQKKWKARTVCEDAFKVPLCKGEAEPTPPTGPGGAAQGAGRQPDGK